MGPQPGLVYFPHTVPWVDHRVHSASQRAEWNRSKMIAAQLG